MAQVLRAELASRQIDTSAQFASMVQAANPGTRIESGTNIWRKVNGFVKITFDDLDRYAAALELDTQEVIARAVALQRSGQVHLTAADRAIADMSPEAAEAVREAAAKVRPPKPRNPDAGVG